MTDGTFLTHSEIIEQNEVFLRWLIIERARYFAKFEERGKLAW